MTAFEMIMASIAKAREIASKIVKELLLVNFLYSGEMIGISIAMFIPSVN